MRPRHITGSRCRTDRRDPDRITLRLSSLSPPARAAITAARNRSEFVRRAVEHYAAGGRAVAEALERIEARLAELEARLSGVQFTSPTAGQAAPEEAVQAAVTALAGWIAGVGDDDADQ